MSSFPLYDQLFRSIETDPIDDTQDVCSFFLSNFSTFTENEHEIIYALIKMYQLKADTTSNSHEIPYNGKRLKKSVKFDFTYFPKGLQNLLYTFIVLHQGRSPNFVRMNK